MLAWIWLDLQRLGRAELRAPCAYFFAYELPLVQAWLAPVLAGEDLLGEALA